MCIKRKSIFYMSAQTGAVHPVTGKRHVIVANIKSPQGGHIVYHYFSDQVFFIDAYAPVKSSQVGHLYFVGIMNLRGIIRSPVQFDVAPPDIGCGSTGEEYSGSV